MSSAQSALPVPQPEIGVAAAPDPVQQKIAAVELVLAKATVRAERAELIIDAQITFSQLLGLTLPPHDGCTETP